MIQNYLMVTLRNFKRNKVFSIINITGLTIGLTACFLIWQYVRFESSYDKFHKYADRLYRVPLTVLRNGTEVHRSATNVPAVGPNMKAEFPEVQEFCRIVKTALFTNDLSSFVANALEFSHQDRNGSMVAFNEENVWFADAPFLSMFSYPLTSGTEDALSQPNAVVITESMARKYFGNEPALGKELQLNREMPLKVTGVLKDIPENSHLQFDMLISFSTMMGNFGDGYNFWDWNVFYNYVLLAPGANVNHVEKKIPAFIAKHLGQRNEGEFQSNYSLQRVTDIHLTSGIAEEQSPVGNERTVYFLSILAIFILVVAWINYINLSTAKALERAKEVGLRKVIGANRKQLIGQFLLDALMVNALAVFLAILLVIALWPVFEDLVGKEMGKVVFGELMRTNLSYLFIALLVFILGVVVVGLYPALILSSFNPVQVLKGKFIKSPSGATLRKLMISFQYVLAVLLIAGTVIIHRQLSYMRSQDPGFDKEQVVVLDAPAVYDSSARDKISFFKNNIMQLPDVKFATASADVPGRTIVERSAVIRMDAPRESEMFNTFIPGIDTGFFSAFGIKLLEGRMFNENEKMAFRRGDNVESIRVLVNEEFVRRLGSKDYKTVLGEKLRFWWGPEERHAEIIGIVSDHHQTSFKERLEPIMFMQPEWTGWKYFSVRLRPGKINETLASIEEVYKKAFADNSFTYFFLDEFFDRQYRDDQQFGNIFNVFTALAIFVTCLGLFGLSAFSVAQRTKEMGIRKVLGASVSTILFLFSKDFVKILITAYVLAAPIIYWAGEKWLENFTFRLPLGWQVFALPLLILMLITILTVGAISIRSSIDTPVKALRQE